MKARILTQFWVVIMKYSPEGVKPQWVSQEKKGQKGCSLKANVYKDFTSDGAETAGRWSREVSREQMWRVCFSSQEALIVFLGNEEPWRNLYSCTDMRNQSSTASSWRHWVLWEDWSKSPFRIGQWEGPKDKQTLCISCSPLSSRRLEVKPNQGITCHALIPFEKMD